MTTQSNNASADKILVDRFKSGDPAAFDEMVVRYHDKIFARVFGLLKNREDAEEVTQDAFVRAHRGLDNFRGEASFSTWLYQIATNLAHNKYWYWFRRKRDKSIYLGQPLAEDSTATVEDILPSKTDGPDGLTMTQELVDRVSECMEFLNPKHREILVLRNVKGMAYEDIAQHLNISVGTVKSRIARARENLKVKLGEEFALSGE
ncbi:MAG: RNA polymerase sigma factor [Opitutales bacterium]